MSSPDRQLTAVLTVREQAEDAAKEALAGALRRHDQAASRLRDVQERISASLDAARSDDPLHAHYRALHVQRLRDDELAADIAVRERRFEVRARQADVANAQAARRVVQRVLDKRADERARQQAAHEQAALEEVALPRARTVAL